MENNTNSASNYDRMTVKNLPKEEQPDEKCRQFGPEALSDAELLAAIIRVGNRYERSVELAYRVLKLSKSFPGLAGINHLSISELMELDGIGIVKAVQIVCIAELSRRLNRAERSVAMSFDNPGKVAEFFKEDMRHLEYEQIRVAFLDVRCKLIYDRCIFTGTVSKSIANPREILIEALKAGASQIVLLHNHPSGDATPSANDIFVTTRLKSACDLIGIKLNDHIVIGDNCYVSMKEAGLI